METYLKNKIDFRKNNIMSEEYESDNYEFAQNEYFENFFDLCDLNSEQINAYNKLSQYEYAISEGIENKCNITKYFLLNGPGGSGKTHTISKFLEKCKLIFKVLAPTHKAVGVLNKTLPKEITVSTIAKYLGYSESIDDDGEKVIKYTLVGNKSKIREQLLIIDECSMVSTEQLDILKQIKINIIFVGDYCQINPVNEEISPVFKLDFFGKAELVKNERIQNENLAELITTFRKSVIDGRLSKKCFDNSYKITDKYLFNETMINHFNNRDQNTVFLAYTNAQVNNYNELIRRKLFCVKESDTLEDYIKGEKLIFTEYFDGYYTSETVIIKKAVKKEYKIYNPKCLCNIKRIANISDLAQYKFIEESCDIKDEPTTKINSCEKCNTPTSLQNYKKINLWAIEIEGDDTVFYKPASEKDKKDIYAITYKYRDRAKQKRNRTLWVDFYGKTSLLNTPFDYSYAMTVHKSQGSGYDNVFIDMENISFCKKESEKLRLMYTAVSRSQHNVFFLK
jgi:exodeoxyribonuclease-5